MEKEFSFEEKQKAYEQLQEFRENYTGRKDWIMRKSCWNIWMRDI